MREVQVRGTKYQHIVERSMHVLFLVHGMGRQEVNWADPVIEKLRDLSQQYNYFKENSFTENVRFEPIRYDFIFDDLLDRWQGNFKGIMDSEASPLIPGGRLREVMQSMSSEERHFFWSHIADVLIYRFFPLVRDRVRMELIREIARKISFHRNRHGNNTRFSFVAHSLGTAVLHDSLHLLGTTAWDDDIANVMGPPHTRFQALFMLANTGRILQSDIDPYESIVCPVGSKNNQASEYLDQYRNILHKFDPITLIRRMTPAGWGTNFSQIELRHVRHPNVHDFLHYLDHPEVHIPLFRVLYGFRAVVPAEEIQARETYPDLDRREIRSELERQIGEVMGELGSGEDLAELVQIWVKLKEFIGEDV